MEDFQINSKLILSAGYHSNNMYLKTTEGRMYLYCSVPQEIFDEFISSKSHDEFYINKIVPSFACRRMS